MQHYTCETQIGCQEGIAALTSRGLFCTSLLSKKIDHLTPLKNHHHHYPSSCLNLQATTTAPAEHLPTHLPKFPFKLSLPNYLPTLHHHLHTIPSNLTTTAIPKYKPSLSKYHPQKMAPKPQRNAVARTGRPAAKGYFSTVYTTLTSAENASVVRSIAIFGVGISLLFIHIHFGYRGVRGGR